MIEIENEIDNKNETLAGEESGIRWERTDPLGRKVVLREKTFTEHIGEDHARLDAEMRKFLEAQAKATIANPGVIIKDETGRLLYYSTIAFRTADNVAKVKILKVVTESDREPAEVVTWTPVRKGNNLRNGVIVYAKNGVPDTEI